MHTSLTILLSTVRIVPVDRHPARDNIIVSSNSGVSTFVEFNDKRIAECLSHLIFTELPPDPDGDRQNGLQECEPVHGVAGLTGSVIPTDACDAAEIGTMAAACETVAA